MRKGQILSNFIRWCEEQGIDIFYVSDIKYKTLWEKYKKSIKTRQVIKDSI